ncbi:MAG: hypothetical protein ABSH51_19190 [Solirubrobacteraceae bacterium]|jgi:hypothetical protein
MSTEITATIRRALRRRPPAEAAVHFHIGGDGRPFVCDVARCDSPGLSTREVGAD